MSINDIRLLLSKNHLFFWRGCAILEKEFKQAEEDEMKRAAVVFHSVLGNTYVLARCYAEYLKKQGVETDLYRVKDDTFEQISLAYEPGKAYRDEIMSLPIASHGAQMTGYDGLFLGSPTYYGCVSAQMKAFMDSFCDIWTGAGMAGRYFGCFTTCGDTFGGGELCLQAMNIFAQHMGMVLLPVPCNIGGAPQPAYGILHVAGGNSEIRMSGETEQAIHGYLDVILKKAI